MEQNLQSEQDDIEITDTRIGEAMENIAKIHDEDGANKLSGENCGKLFLTEQFQPRS